MNTRLDHALCGARGTPLRPNPENAVKALVLLLGFFDGGRRWISGYAEHEGRHCLIAGVLHISSECDINGRFGAEYCPYYGAHHYSVCHYLRSALSRIKPDYFHNSDVDLIDYNDDASDYSTVRDLITKAINLARSEIANMGRARGLQKGRLDLDLVE
jgi:hypothetical protein